MAMDKEQEQYYQTVLNPKKTVDKDFFLALLDDEKQKIYEDDHMQAVLFRLRRKYIDFYQQKIRRAEERIASIRKEGSFSAEDVATIAELNESIAQERKEMDTYKCFFNEPYFARMDLTDEIEGYNSYYIGKKGDINLEIVDWRAPLAKKYYQKSQINFAINQYRYQTVLRRAIRTKNGKVLEFKNEYLSVRAYLSQEEIAGRDEEIIFDPFLKQIIKERKEESNIRDIIQTIQEQQYDIITQPEQASFVVQGCAGSGKTMILLHRLSYLMYNNERIAPRDVLVITPSDSFNAFIDELAQVLELEKVKTTTIDDYFLQLLQKEGIDITDKIRSDEAEPKEYLAYLYSDEFYFDCKKKIDKTFDGIHGMFAAEECQDIIHEIIEHCGRQKREYESLKNASLRVRRAVLGEIKERQEGGIYYTKPFREFMNGILEIEEFLSLDLNSERMRNNCYFYQQLAVFYQSVSVIARSYERVCADAVRDLQTLQEAVKKEIVDLHRYKQKRNEGEVLTYADRIAKRKLLLTECAKAIERVESIRSESDLYDDFYRVLKGEKRLQQIGGCSSTLELIRLFYKDLVKKAKGKYGVASMHRSDAYALVLLLSLLGKQLSPRYGFVFIDEGQDISANEYRIIRANNPTAAINLFGDLQQNVTDFRGLKKWEDALAEEVFELNQNYRNTNQIVGYVEGQLGISMQAIGFDGSEVQEISARGITAFFAEKKGLRAIIVSESAKEKYYRKGYRTLSEKGEISKTKINFMTVYESKGLEFSSVVVVEEGMTKNEKYIAYTRALKDLAVIKE